MGGSSRTAGTAMTIAIVSCDYGQHDTAKHHAAQDVDVEFVHLTADGDRVTAKGPKLRPWDYAEDADTWIYVDASFEITSASFAREIVELTTGPLGQYRHPARDCIYDEASFTKLYARKYDEWDVVAQAAHYSTTGHPRNWGLWNTGVIVYRERLPYLADLWEAEIRRWGPQCQVSQPVALRRAGIRPVTLPGVVYDTPWMTHHAHNDGTR